MVIERKDFEDLIRVYDRKNALFYLDPPYKGTERYYNAKFSMEDHLRLKKVLHGLQGKFILSYNNDPFIHDLYKEFQIREVDRRNSLPASSNDEPYRELIITNF